MANRYSLVPLFFISLLLIAASTSPSATIEKVPARSQAKVNSAPGDSVPFSGPTNYYAGEGASSVFAADLDQDGDLDMALTNLYGQSISIYKNNGDGTFQTKVDYAVGVWPRSVFCADLDGDRDLDLAVTNRYDNNVSILKNNGDGTFRPRASYQTGISPVPVFCADLDGDSDLDLAVGNHLSHNVSVLLNKGDGSFQPRVDYSAVYWQLSVFCADLDGDKDLDIVSAGEGGSVSILKNNGDGTFQPKIEYRASQPTSVFCVDLDGDQDLDLAVTNAIGGTVSVFKNNGDGTFQPKVDYPAGDIPYSVFCEDLDGDKDLDLVIASSISSDLAILKNNGDGTFQPRTKYLAGKSPGSVFCADLDKDGDFDLAVANLYSNDLSIFMNLTQIPANQPPHSFSLFLPEDGDSLASMVTLSWQNSYDPNFSDQIRYAVYISTLPDFNPDSTVIYDNLTLTRLSCNLKMGKYYWKVRAYDPSGSENWSEQTWGFYVSSHLVPYSLLSPTNLESVPTSVRFEWEQANGFNPEDTVWYTLYLSRSPVFNPDSSHSYDSLLETQLQDSLDMGLYHWKIKARDLFGEVRWSNQTWSFSVFLRGDANFDGKVAISDVIYLIRYLTSPGSPEPTSLEAADANCDGKVAISDVVFLVNYLFKGGPKPAC